LRDENDGRFIIVNLTTKLRSPWWKGGGDSSGSVAGWPWPWPDAKNEDDNTAGQDIRESRVRHIRILESGVQLLSLRRY